MAVTSALVLFAVIWAMTFLVILPIRVQTQGDVGKIVPGTHAGAPEVHNLRKKAWVTTAISLALWAMISSIIVFEVITVRDLDWFNRGSPAPAASGTDA